MNPNRQRGFTLIEIGIVVTIIGILLASVFVGGRALTASAKRKTAIAQVADLRSSLATFRDRYKYLPGDFPATTEITDLSTNCKKGGKPNGDGVVSADESPCAVEQLVKSGLATTETFAAKVATEVQFFSSAAAVAHYKDETGKTASVSINSRVSTVLLFANLPCDAAQAVDSAFDDGDLTTKQVVALGGACDGDALAWLAVPAW